MPRSTANGLGNNWAIGVFVSGTNGYVATDAGMSITTDGGAMFTTRTDINGLGNKVLWTVRALP